MKQKDIALIIVIVAIGGAFSFVISNKFISPPDRNEKAAKVIPITAEFSEPNRSFFNDQSINPTQLIQISNGENKTPLKSN